MNHTHCLILCLTLTLTLGCTTTGEPGQEVASPVLDMEGAEQSEPGMQGNEAPLNIERGDYPGPDAVRQAKKTIAAILTNSQYGSANYSSLRISNIVIGFEETIGGYDTVQRTIPLARVETMTARQIPDAMQGREFALDFEFNRGNPTRIFVDSREQVIQLYEAFEVMVSYAKALEEQNNPQ